MPLFPGKRSGLLWLLLLLLPVPTYAGEGFWTTTGPPVGVGALAISSGAPSVVIAAGEPVGGAQEVVFTKSDSQSMWIERAEASTGVTITSLAVDPSNPSTVYATGSVDGDPPDGALYVSLDTGSTWSFLHLFTKSPVFTVAVDPANSSTIYVGGSVCSKSSCTAFFSRSGDAGSTWSSSPLFSWASSVTALAINPRQANRMYAATDYGVLSSGDSGMTWIGQFGTPEVSGERLEITSIAISPANPEIIFVGWHLPCGFFEMDCGGALGKGGAAVTSNGGYRWVVLNSPNQVTALAISSTDPDTVYAGSNVGIGGVFKSQDGGASWSKLGDLDACFGLQLDSRRRVIYAAAGTGVFEYEDTPLASPHVLPKERNVRKVLPRP